MLEGKPEQLSVHLHVFVERVEEIDVVLVFSNAAPALLLLVQVINREH